MSHKLQAEENSLLIKLTEDAISTLKDTNAFLRQEIENKELERQSIVNDYKEQLDSLYLIEESLRIRNNELDAFSEKNAEQLDKIAAAVNFSIQELLEEASRIRADIANSTKSLKGLVEDGVININRSIDEVKKMDEVQFGELMKEINWYFDDARVGTVLAFVRDAQQRLIEIANITERSQEMIQKVLNRI